MIAPRHWEFDRPQTWEEYEGPYGGILCMDCGTKLTSFATTTRRMLDDSMVEITFSDEDVTPMYEVICTNCAARTEGEGS